MSIAENVAYHTESRESLNKRAHPAFVYLEPTSLDYATLSIKDAFTWDVFAKHANDLERAFMVVFRSELSPAVDETDIALRDDAAREDAENQPGYIGYFKGKRKIGSPYNVSFCLWDSRENARAAADRGPHVHAAKLRTVYDQYQIELYDVIINRDPTGVSIDITPYQGGHRKT